MKILIAGDFCQKNRVDTAIKKKAFNELFNNITPVIGKADYSIVNFEFPIVVDSSQANPIAKCGHNLKGTIEAVDAVLYAGFDCCTLANNHILDQGEQCCVDTKKVLENAGIDNVGVGENIAEAQQTLYKELNGITIAIINCCEHEFSIAGENSAGANPYNPIAQYYAIVEAKNKADYVLVIVHGGHELYPLPSPRMKETYRFFIDCGADAVINHHQHVYSGYEVYNDKPIFYGLGNFLFDNAGKTSLWNYGFMVLIETSDNSFEIFPYEQCKEDATVKLLEDNDRSLFEKIISGYNITISDNNHLKNNFDNYAKNHSMSMKAKLSPYSNNYIQEAIVRGIIPSFVTKKKIIEILNYIECEAHRDFFVEALKTLLRK